MTTTKEYTVRLPAETAEVLRSYAFATGTSVNEIFKRAINDYLVANGHREAVAAAFNKALEDHSEAFAKLEHL
jgi:predicted DNA-binding protein